MQILGVPVFEGVGPISFGFLLAVYFFVNVAKGVFGYGSLPPLVLLGAFVLAPHHSVLLAFLNTCMTHLQYMPVAVRKGNFRLTGRVVLFFAPGVAFGVYLFQQMQAQYLSAALATVIVLIVIAEMYDLFARLRKAAERQFEIAFPVFCAISGTLAGMVGAGGMVMMSVILKTVIRTAEEFRATMLLTAGGVMAVRLSILLVSGLVDLSLFFEALALLPVGYAGGLIGAKVFSRLTDAVYFRWYRGFLLIAATILLLRSLNDLI